MDSNKEKQEAISWSEKNLVGKSIYNKSIDAKISFTRKGIKHSICARIAPLKIAFIYDLPKLLENAVLFDIQGDRKGRPDIKKVLKMFTNWRYKDENYFVHMFIRVMKDGHVYYDHEVIKEKNLS